MIIGAHSIIYSKNPEADRAFLRDVLGMPNVDVGDGWLIFGLPPAEVAVHPSSKNDVHEFYLMCRDVEALIAEMRKHKIDCSPVHAMDWGILTQVMLPGGGKLGIYQPRHARPKSMSVKRKTTATRAKKNVACETQAYSEGLARVKRLFRIHRYLSCIVAPAMLFFAVSGAWQAFRFQQSTKDGTYVAPAPLKVLSQFHMAERLQGPGATWFRAGQGVLAAAFATTAIIGVVMAFQLTKPRWLIWACLAIGVAIPALLALVARR